MRTEQEQLINVETKKNGEDEWKTDGRSNVIYEGTED